MTKIINEPAEKSNIIDLPKTTIMRTLAWLHPDPDSVFELCALDPDTRQSPLWDGFATAAVAGWYRDREKAALVAVQLKATGVYTTLNPTVPALLGRANERLKAGAKRTKDTEIERIRNVLVDLDPERPEGVSSTDAEHTAALDMAQDIKIDLTTAGLPDPLETDSGNGAGLVFAVDLPNTPETTALLKAVLEALATKYADTLAELHLHLDISVHNPARLTRLLGTPNRKGDSTADRPHRQAKIVSLPATRTPVTLEQLQALVGTRKDGDKPPDGHQGRQAHQAPGTAQTTGILDVAGYLAHYGVEVVKTKAHGDGTLFCLAECIFDRSHAYPDAVISQTSFGRPGYKCFHASCAGKTWRDARRIISGDAKLYQFMPGWTGGRKAPAAAPGGAAAPAPAAGYTLSDLGNARRFVAQHGENIRYCHPARQWWHYNGQHWTPDKDGTVRRLAKQTISTIYGEAAAAGDDLRKALASHALRSEHAARLAGMLSLAESEPGIPVLPEQFDADVWLFNCENGTLDLRHGTLRPHNRADLITRLAPAKFDPVAQCPRFEKFLLEIMAGDTDMVSFLQRALGYSLTGDCREQCFFVPFGHGANGKSTLLAIILYLLGTYALQTQTDTLLTKRNDGIPNDVARLDGARFVSALEVNQGRRLNESFVKGLVGQDSITARFMFQEFFDFRPQLKLWLATNHRPVIKDTSHAMWRRVKLLPFTVTIDEPEQDKDLPAKLKAESAGILAWCVRGCLSWRHGGLGVPDVVRAATEEYREEQDATGSFIADCCVQAPGASATAKELYGAYTDWCESAGEKRPLTQRAFGMALAERGFERDRGTAGRIVWYGIGLLTND